jgi:hypothetical protein
MAIAIFFGIFEDGTLYKARDEKHRQISAHNLMMLQCTTFYNIKFNSPGQL